MRWLIVAGGVFVTALIYIARAALELSVHFRRTGARPAVVRPLRPCRRTANVLALVLPAAACVSEGGTIVLGASVGGQYRNEPRSSPAAAVAFFGLETPYLRPILEPNPRIPRRANVEPLIEPIRGSVGMAQFGSTFRETKTPILRPYGAVPNVPTPAAVEDSERFLQAEDATSIAAAWRPFDYVWISELPSVEAGIGLARFSAGVGQRASTACGQHLAARSRSSHSARTFIPTY